MHVYLRFVTSASGLVGKLSHPFLPLDPRYSYVILKCKNTSLENFVLKATDQRDR